MSANALAAALHVRELVAPASAGSLSVSAMSAVMLSPVALVVVGHFALYAQERDDARAAALVLREDAVETGCMENR